MKALPANAREQLRAAERAWIAFTEENASALQALGKKRGELDLATQVTKRVVASFG